MGHEAPRDTTASRARTDVDTGASRVRLRLRPARHSARLIGGRLRCAVCFRSALTSTVLAQLPCRFPAADERAHALRVVCGILFCSVCGAYSSNRTRALHGRCPKEASGSRATSLRRLLRGRHPKSGEELAVDASARMVLARGQSIAGGVGGIAASAQRIERVLPKRRWRACQPWGECECRDCQVMARLAPRSQERYASPDSASDGDLE